MNLTGCDMSATKTWLFHLALTILIPAVRAEVMEYWMTVFSYIFSSDAILNTFELCLWQRMKTIKSKRRMLRIDGWWGSAGCKHWCWDVRAGSRVKSTLNVLAGLAMNIQKLYVCQLFCKDINLLLRTTPGSRSRCLLLASGYYSVKWHDNYFMLTLRVTRARKGRWMKETTSYPHFSEIEVFNNYFKRLNSTHGWDNFCTTFSVRIYNE